MRRASAFTQPIAGQWTHGPNEYWPSRAIQHRKSPSMLQGWNMPQPCIERTPQSKTGNNVGRIQLSLPFFWWACLKSAITSSFFAALHAEEPLHSSTDRCVQFLSFTDIQLWSYWWCFGSSRVSRDEAASEWKWIKNLRWTSRPNCLLPFPTVLSLLIKKDPLGLELQSAKDPDSWSLTGQYATSTTKDRKVCQRI